MNTAQRETQRELLELAGKNRLFRPTNEEVSRAVARLRPVLSPKPRDTRPREDQLSIEEVMP